MKTSTRIVSSLFALVLVAGCGSAVKVTEHDEYKEGKAPRPAHIWVYDFVATAADVPADSALVGKHGEHPAPQTPEEIESGRQAGAIVATQLVEEIQGMGLPAVRASSGSKPQINDLVFRGYILSIDEGDQSKRVLIGFGAGTSEMSIAVEGLQMTAQGLQKVGGGSGGSGGNITSKTPGAVAGGAATIATLNPMTLIVSTGVKVHGEYSGSSKSEGRAKELAKEIAAKIKPKFQEQGWIQ